jgi:hypothetical protein
MKIEIKIGKGIHFDSSDLALATETADGFVFEMKHGFHIRYENNDMPNSVKQVICQCCMKYNAKKVIINPLNYSTPVVIEG